MQPVLKQLKTSRESTPNSPNTLLFPRIVGPSENPATVMVHQDYLPAKFKSIGKERGSSRYQSRTFPRAKCRRVSSSQREGLQSVGLRRNNLQHVRQFVSNQLWTKPGGDPTKLYRALRTNRDDFEVQVVVFDANKKMKTKAAEYHRFSQIEAKLNAWISSIMCWLSKTWIWSETWWWNIKWTVEADIDQLVPTAEIETIPKFTKDENGALFNRSLAWYFGSKQAPATKLGEALL